MRCSVPSACLLVCLSCLAPPLALTASAAADRPAPYVWVEAETTATINFDGHWTGSDRAHLLSGGKLLAAVFKGDAIRKMPQEGFVLTYELAVPETGRYDGWFRVGMEGIRAPFEWRIGEGPWHAGPADRYTTNVMELARYNEIAWLHVGSIDLEAGKATLTVRYTKTQPGRSDLWIMLDCVAFVQAKAGWRPDGPLKPGERYDGEADRAARRKVHPLPAPGKAGERSRVELTGPWQVARWDDDRMDARAHDPETALPELERLQWRGVEVPARQWSIDGLNLAHRTIYRTRVRVPKALAGRGFTLHFSGTNWLASVFVNGELAGTHKGVWIPWDLDVSRHVRPGEVNEIAVAIKGPWYAIDTKHYRGGTTLMAQRNRPIGNLKGVQWLAPIYPSSKGDGNGAEYGLVNPVTLIAAGGAYTEDVFVQPRGKGTRPDGLGVDVTVRNTARSSRTLEVACQAVHDRTGKVEKDLGRFGLTVPAGAAVTHQADFDAWRDPKLWWPEPKPHLYRLRTTIREGGKVVDVHEQLFGFRWITTRDRGMYLNGRRFNTWNWVNVSGRPDTAEQWLAAFRGEGNRFTRFSQNRKTRAFLPTREQRLAFYDRNGIPGRLCSMIDGMFISFHLGEKRVSTVTGKPFMVENKPLWEGWRRHIAQLTRAYRNHPSVLVYQVENELIYINGMNRAYPQDAMEDLMGDVIGAGRANDPTRPYTVGGAGDLNCRCEINAPHYPLGELDWYPENAYTLEKIKDKLRMYPPFYHNKPWTVGESLFANHLKLGTVALGDEAFRSAEDAARGKCRFLRDVYEGYRYGGAAGFYPWDNLSRFEDGRKVFSALAVIPRKRTHRLYGGRSNVLRVKVMNDTLRTEPVLFEWAYATGAEPLAKGREEIRIEPGCGEERLLKIDPPAVKRRLDGVLTVKVTQPGAEQTLPYEDTWPVPVLPAVTALNAQGAVLLLDPSGKVAAFLKAAGRPFTALRDLSEADGKAGLLIVGPDALSPKDAFGRGLLKFAARGGQVIVLEQDNPVGGANLPAPLHATPRYGGYAHPQALGTPVFRDLGKTDLIDWAGDHPTYKGAYEKPDRGGRSLAQCGAMLEQSVLVEAPAGKGVLVLCQLRVGAKLGEDPAADVLLRNLIEHYADHRPATGVAAVYAPRSPRLLEALARIGVSTAKVASVSAALDAEKYRAAVIGADRQALQALVEAGDRAAAFQQAGGWIVLNGLTPDGMAAFNRLVGREHLIRPFRMERVTLERPDHPLAATLGNRDLTMYSPEHLQHSKDWISRNVYTYVVDAHADAAPFTQPPGAPEDIQVYEPTRDDHDPYNFVNDMLISDHWRYIQQVWIGESDKSKSLTFRFRRPETLAKVLVSNVATYSTIKDLAVVFDGDEKNAVRVVLPDADEPTEIALNPPRRVAKSVTLRVESWRPHRPREGGFLVGIDNVEFLRAEAPGRVCLDNVGGLVAYPKGAGGVFLMQTKFMADEPRPVNASKKLTILSTVLTNMGIGSGASVVAVPGVNVQYEPVSLLDHCTQYLSNRTQGPGWFGLGAQDMSLLPTGRRRLKDDVVYHVVDYATAPVPDCIVLGVRGAPKGLPAKVEGIDVGKTADLLFFLHTALVHRPITPDERKRIGAARRPFEPPVVLRYVLHYSDGRSVTLPAILDQHVAHWLRTDPSPLPRAQVAATARVPGLDRLEENELRRRLFSSHPAFRDLPLPKAGDVRAVVYGMQVRNPRPEVAIERIDVLPGADAGRARAVGAVLGITLGRVRR